ncbi:hypothetical protein XANCAGTX0491_008570 [Xanthoria calcicola]
MAFSPNFFSPYAQANAGDILLWSSSLETEEFQVFIQSGSSLGPAYPAAPATTETSSPPPATPLSDYQNVDWSPQQLLQTPNDPQIFALPDRSVGLAPSPAPPLATAATTPSSTTTTSSVAVRPRDDNDADADADAGQSPSKRAKPAPPRTPTTTKPPRPRRTTAPAPAPTPRRRRARARAQQTTTTRPSSSGSGSGSSPPTQTLTFAAPSTPANMYASLAASGLKTDKYRPLQTGGRKGFRGREAKLLD